MKSMTGYGAATRAFGEGELVVEIRALNHRHLDVRTAASADLGAYAHAAEQVLRKAVHRGRYELRLRTTGATPVSLGLDVDAARELHRELVALKGELGDDTPVSLEGVLSILPEPLRAPKVTEETAAQVASVVRDAVAALDEMRATEGDTLRNDILGALDKIGAHREDAAKRCADNVERQRARLTERVDKLLGDTKLDEDRMQMEIAVLAERTDVAEELVRLESHETQLRSLLTTSADAVGRKLDFLLQELNREANTLSAKCQNAEVTHIAVEIKAEIERMRQQAANVL